MMHSSNQQFNILPIVNHIIHQTYVCQSCHQLHLSSPYNCPCIYGHHQSLSLIRYEIALHWPSIIRCGQSSIIYTFSPIWTPAWKLNFFCQQYLNVRLLKCVMFCPYFFIFFCYQPWFKAVFNVHNCTSSIMGGCNEQECYQKNCTWCCAMSMLWAWCAPNDL
jgi:hypothetical protein